MKKPSIRLFPKIKPRRGTLESEGGKGQRYCPNCHYPLPHYGEFCSNCSQRYTNGRVPLKYLLQDFIDNVLNIDSKFFRTIWSLAIPGKLTNEFFEGRHKRFASPARLFFVATVIHFAVLGYMLNGVFEKEFSTSIERNKRNAYELSLRDSLAAAKERVTSMFRNQPVAQEALDSLFAQVKGEHRDSMYIGYMYFDDNWELEPKSHVISNQELYSKSPAELAEAKGITNKMESLIFQQIAKINTHADNFGQYAISQLVWMVVLMMPALAFILKLLYIRRKRFFVEHLVFSFHYHAFAFWVLTIMLLIMDWTDSWNSEAVSGLLPSLVILGILVYLFIAMRKVYKQGFFKTFIKYNILNFAYLMIFTFFFTLTLLAGVMMF
jgi:hypothetical protein